MSVQAAVYARYSSHAQSEQSIEGQLAAARQYAQAKGYEIVAEYCDRAQTGRNDNRDAFQNMLRDSAKKVWSVLITWKIDRIGRNREEIAFHRYRLKKNGIRIEYVAEQVPDSPEGVILEAVLEGMAEYYSLQLAQNIRRGYRESAKKCKVAGSILPLGYRKGEDGRYEIDPDTAPTVKWIYEEYAKGRTSREIVDELNEKGVKTSTGGAFSRTSLQHMLGNEKYKGIYIGMKGEIRIEGGIPAIVSEELWDQVKDMRVKNKRMASARDSSSEYLLTGKVFCGKCGAVMAGESGYGKKGVKYRYYSCVSRKRKHTCDKQPVNKELLEDAVLQATIRVLEDRDYLSDLVDELYDYYVSQDSTKAELASLENELRAAERAEKNLVKAVEQGLPFSAVQERFAEISGQKAALETAIRDVRLSMDVMLTKEQIRFYLDRMAKLSVTDTKAKKKLIHTFVNAVYVYDDHLDIAYNIEGDADTVPLGECSAAAPANPLNGTPPNIGFCRKAFVVRASL